MPKYEKKREKPINAQSSIPVPGTNHKANTGGSFRSRQDVRIELATILATTTLFFLSASIVDTNEQKYFRHAILKRPSSTAIDQRWFIEFYVYDVQKEKSVRKRFYNIPEGNDDLHREYLAERICAEINKQLIQGKVIDRFENFKNQTIHNNQSSLLTEKISTASALEKVLLLKEFKELRTKQTYSSLIESLNRFIDQSTPHIPFSLFDIAEATNFIKWLQLEGKSPRTINNHILSFRTLWDEAIALKYGNNNPWKNISKLKTPVGKNIAFLPAQQKEIIDYCELRYPTMSFLTKFMYYSLARTNEICHLQIKHIGMYLPNKIYLEASISKNDTERHIIIPPGLEVEFEKYNIRSLNPEWYIFSRNKLHPGPNKMPTKYMGSCFREWVLNKLNYPKDYTLYSWKHTGVISAHKAGVSDDDIMKQTGHKDYGSFQKYLKSLGLFDNDQFANKIPTL